MFWFKRKKGALSEKAQCWNRFVYELGFADLKTLTEAQIAPCLVFVYYSEVNHGGYLHYFENYCSVTPDEMKAALTKVGADMYIENYCEAAEIGELDEYQKTDMEFFKMTPNLGDILQDYVFEHRDTLF